MSKFKNLFLFATAALIWGSTWLVITFQLGVVEPVISVFYRFLLSSIILIIYCFSTGRNLKYGIKEHLFMAQLGFLLFGVNYWLTYQAESFITSGLVAVAFSTIAFFNIINGAIFLKSKIKLNVLISTLVGFTGIALVFKNEILNFTFTSSNSYGFFLAMIGAFVASLGNITSARNQKKNLPVIQTNAIGMMYGAFFMLILIIFKETPFTFDFSLSYTLSLLYLSIFGSVIAFGAYLTLIGNIGADKAGYVALVFPIIALILSTFFENYQWTHIAGIGLVLITIGNVLVLRKKNVGTR